MIRAHRIRLKLNKEQERLCRQACGVARFSYNWALAEWDRQHKAGEKVSVYKLVKLQNSIKSEKWPWMLEVTKCAPQYAIHDLGNAFKRFFSGIAKYPKFKKKGKCKDSFRLETGGLRAKDKSFLIPRVGWVRMYEKLRFEGKMLWATVHRIADRWFVSIVVEIPDPPKSENQAEVGVDMGIATLATLSTGEKFESPKALKRNLEKLRRLHRSVTRKKKRSQNRQKAVVMLSKLYARIARIRLDGLHRLSTSIAQRFGFVGLEDLNIAGMQQNKKLARSISDMGWYELRLQLEYKMKERGGIVQTISQWEPTSKRCNVCKMLVQDLHLSDRQWTCKICNTHHDRDVNAAINILVAAKAAYAEKSSVSACGEDTAQAPSMKQEVSNERRV